MKKKDQTVEEPIMKSHYLTALDSISKADEPLCDMESEAFLETIRDLKESIRNANEMNRSLQETIRTLQADLERSRLSSEQHIVQITDLRSAIADLRTMLDKREQELSDLRDQNRRHNKS